MTDIHDIKPVLPVSVQWGWLWWILAALVLLAAGLLWWRRKRTSSDMPVTAAMLSPQDEALARLEHLAAQGAIGGKLFYFRLSAILRQYLERRFDIPAAEMTMEELLPAVDRLPLTAELACPLKDFCRAAEPVKFADAPVEAARMPRDLDFVRSFVQRTTPGDDARLCSEDAQPGRLVERDDAS